MTDPRPIGFWLKLVDRLIDEQFAHTLDEHGVTRRQWQLLNVLAQRPATTAELDAAIAPFLAPGSESAPPESSAEHLTELIDSAWVDATPTGYELTDRGRASIERLTDVVAEQRTVAMQGIDESEYLAVVGVLEHVAHNLGWSDE
jgi:DNA-binding MarR family transcriptional regulator